MLDDVDLKILELLQDNARVANAEIARSVGLTPPAALERIRKLEKRGVLQGFHARLAPAELGCAMLAFIFLRTDEPLDDKETADAISRLPEVQELHHVAGEDCYLLKVRVASPKALGRFLRKKLGKIPTVLSTRTTVVLETVKEDPRLALCAARGERDAS